MQDQTYDLDEIDPQTAREVELELATFGRPGEEQRFWWRS